ncbi:hypothetical protein GKE82_25995 [Conexibacter sp. W3-3-2]|uniref:hypothetical protein n=1 Tax=Conexibacter sp. W3-3-2 TaxID=2675227 RepID=UPI0012B750EA|nr:hypothetical protein [Conexibacter sp. W3-3-2]MTD47657.1 hypothetical protein [Conexibacter sp. W3-3-2]
MTAHHNTTDQRQNNDADTDQVSMGRDPLLTEAQAVIGRGLLMLLRDTTTEGMTLAEIRTHLIFIEGLMALPRPDAERYIPAHQLARDLLTNP